MDNVGERIACQGSRDNSATEVHRPHPSCVFAMEDFWRDMREKRKVYSSESAGSCKKRRQFRRSGNADLLCKGERNRQNNGNLKITGLLDLWCRVAPVDVMRKNVLTVQFQLQVWEFPFQKDDPIV